MNDNAAVRWGFVSEIYEEGVKKRKAETLACLPARYASLHKEGRLHIHDLEAFGKVYNCCIPDIHAYMKNRGDDARSQSGKIQSIFSAYKAIIMDLGASQSGGIAFANFDQELSDFFDEFGIIPSHDNLEFVRDTIKDFIFWLNRTKTRYNREPYYVSLNVGLSVTKWGREVLRSLLTGLHEIDPTYTRPNIIFKTCDALNGQPGTPNHDLYQLALKTTAKRMIPTYLLLDSEPNRDCDFAELALMGCRTRVYQNENGRSISSGRGNLACVSINLPSLALEDANVIRFFNNLDALMEDAIEILKLRCETFRENGKTDFVLENQIWAECGSTDDMIKNGTLSVGFIGLAETVEILAGEKMHKSMRAATLAMDIVKKMRRTMDDRRYSERLNYSLLASPGEMISGRFCAIDKKLYNHRIHEKGFYTNSFHIEVDSHVPLLEKIRFEGKFHALCNGGSITYVEFREAPAMNIQALEDAVYFAQQHGVSYLGFNFPLDICRNCSNTGTFDSCPSCGSAHVKRLRRVSGYVEDLDYFTAGKQAEVNKRCPNGI